MRILIVLILILFSVQPVFSNTAEEYLELSPYLSGRAIVNALKVVGSDEATQGMKATTMQFGAGLAAGTYLRYNNVAFRFEVDYSYTMRANSFYHSIMGNIYIEAAYKPQVFAPYIMAGVGINIFDPPFAVIESNFAYNAGAGIIIPLKNRWSLDLGFRYMESSINFHTGDGTMKVKNHNFYIGTRYIF